jgi:hypothetical protein
MERLLRLALNQFAVTPPTLRIESHVDIASPTLKVNLASLYHHYYLDSFGQAPPDPDPAQFEPVRFLCSSPEFRFAGSGLGEGTLIRRNRSSELGNAFCRMFLHDHLNITYFSHMEDVLDKSSSGAFGDVRVERAQPGDTPDYLCAKSAAEIFLAEAKGRYRSIGFGTKAFGKWRKQFSRVSVKDASGTLKSLKGYIVATRWATEHSKPSVHATLYAEDPSSPGDEPLNSDDARTLGEIAVSNHYGYIARKLGQPVLSAALLSGSTIPGELRIIAAVWELQFGPFAGMKFVGGFFAPSDDYFPVRNDGQKFLFGATNPFRLDSPRGTLFGVEERIFRQVVQVARQGPRLAGELTPLDGIVAFQSAISALKDGSILGPLEFFAGLGVREY